jgi:hypothetical protein
VGIVAGSLAGSRERTLAELRRRFLLGLLLVGLGFVGAAEAPAYTPALVTFLVAGVGNGLVVVNERLLIQRSVADALMGRIFATGDALGNALFTMAFLGAGALLTLMGTRALLTIAGAGAMVVWALAAVALRGRPAARPKAQPPEGSKPVAARERSLS